MEAWWAHTVVLATPVIYTLASIPAGGLRGTDMLIYRGDREGSGIAPYIWHPDLPRPHLRLYGCGSYCKPTQAGVWWGETTTLNLESGGFWPWRCLSQSNFEQVVSHLGVSVSSSVK